MWIRKWQRDRAVGVDSPIPTQVVSNEEIWPRRQNSTQKRWEHRIAELSAANARRVGMDRRSFLRSPMGLATAFWAANEAYGQPYWEVRQEEMFEPAAHQELRPQGEHFIFDVQAHFTEGYALNFRQSEFMRSMGFDLPGGAEGYSFSTFFKEMLLDSETDMLVISGVPGRERSPSEEREAIAAATLAGDPVDRRAVRGGGVLPSWAMASRRDEVNRMAGSLRALSQSNCAPNHYWDTVANRQDRVALKEQMTREVQEYGTASWKLYCHFDPARTGHGFQLDDEDTAYFYEVARELGQTTVSVHKGYASQSRRFGHLANPRDIERAALNNPDITFVVYHSALKHGPTEPNFEDPAFFDPTTGDFAWHDVLMGIKRRNPGIDNVYCEIGSAFGTLAIAHPVMCMHLMGKNIQHYGSDRVLWGTDCIWWGSPQWCIEAFKRFQISDEICERFGYSKLSREDKRRIFGLNAAALYAIDPEESRRAHLADGVARMKTGYRERGINPDNAAHGWVRASA
ncbi:MAG: amidohydrolase family protein [Bryobacterales bacterium]|nr:amidohydrolase family protein [Bryobacterales bacterium]